VTIQSEPSFSIPEERRARPAARSGALMRKLAWYRARLASMSTAEVAHRVVEQAMRTTARWRSPDFAAVATPGALPAIPGLADGVQALAAAHPELVERWRAVARRAAEGRFRLLGVEWPGCDRHGRWHVDPTTGRSWPAEPYCFDISFRHTEGLGDVKHVWEVNRLQHLQAAAALAACTGDGEISQSCAAEIESWIDHNPPFRGVNWASGIELALRAISIMTVVSLLPAAAFPGALRAKVRAALAAHGHWLMRYPSLHSSANNHLIAEAAGLYLIGTLAPDLDEGGRWAAYGRRTLIDEAFKQIHPDGVGAEQSPTYTAFTLEFLMLAGCVAGRVGAPFPDAFWARLEAAGECLRWFTDAAGNQPRIGDDDEGRVFISQVEPESYTTSVLAALAGLRGRADLVPPGVEPHLRHAVLSPPPAPDAAPLGVRRFADGGYTVFRWAEGGAKGGVEGGTDCLAAFDHGPLGYLSIAAHGHADALALWLHVGGQPVLIDAGTFLYHSGGDWRSHFRGTPAHNTLSIAGEDSSRIAGPFNWSAKARTAMLGAVEGPDLWSVEAEHDGFRQRHGARHRRRLERRGNRLIVTDRLVGAARPLPVEIGFLIHPELSVTHGDAGWTIADGTRVLAVIAGGAPLAASLERGVSSPRRGWCSPAFGARMPAPRLVLRGDLGPEDASRVTITVLPGTVPPE